MSLRQGVKLFAVEEYLHELGNAFLQEQQWFVPLTMLDIPMLCHGVDNFPMSGIALILA